VPEPALLLVVVAWSLAFRCQMPAGTSTCSMAMPSSTGIGSGSSLRPNLWAELMQRSFGIDVLTCPRCGDRLTLVGLIQEARVIRRILAHLRLPTEVPAARPARSPPGGRLDLDGGDAPARPCVARPAGDEAGRWYDPDIDIPCGRESLPPYPFQPGRMVLPNMPLQALIRMAFGVPDQRIEGWPDRDLAERRFTVTATYSGTSTPPAVEQQRLVREVLLDRFGMRARIQQREQAVYALRLLEPGVLGPGIVEVDYDCTDPETRARRGHVDCHGGDHAEERGHVSRGSGPIGSLVARLQLELRGRLVVDQTGLDGFYKWGLLRWERRGDGVALPPPPPLHELLPVQLGMTIEDTRAPVEVVVIDAISMPTPN
jgi:uncharacterized protein (TIGR03435 family)